MMPLPSTLASLPSRIFGMGVDPSMDPRRAKRIILSNQISISIALLSLPFVLIYLSTGAAVLAVLEVPMFLGYASVHRINGAGYTWLSRFGLITLANLDILIYSVSLGTSVGQHLFFMLAGWTPLVLFNGEERKSIVYGITLSCVLLLGTEAFAPAVGLLDPVSSGSVYDVRMLEMATLVIVQGLLIIYFLRGNRSTEIALAEAGQAAKSADEVKSRFLARMSDEIRTPLNEILSLSHLLLKSDPGPDKRETLEDIQLSAQDLMSIVDEILDLSRIESGRMRLERLPFSPLRLGHSVLRPFEFEAGRKDLSLSLETDPGLPGHLVGDAARLKQVLRNLLGNAFKFTEKGKVVLRILNGGPGNDGAPSLVFEIEDTGIGVPEEARTRIFEPFSQADASTTRKFGGTGLGLFISKQLVELMGGNMGLRSRPEGGTIFHFQIPLASVAAKPESESVSHPTANAGTEGDGIQSPSVAEEADGGPAPAMRILVVDDHSMNRKLLDSFLTLYGYRADMAASAEEALAACERGPYHLILMDCHMPGMDGYECTRRLRQGPRQGSRPTIIGVTADAVDNILRNCLDAGMDGLLVKPIMENKLRALVEECAARSFPPSRQ
jgi:signal transduction histidine kinase/ActR/RegA family two-component response regulator